MPVTGSARSRATLPSPAGKLSAADGGSLSVSLTGVTTPDSVSVAFGVVDAGPPATYADIVIDWGNTLPLVGSSLDGKKDPDSGIWTYTLTVPVFPAVFTVGQEVWVAVFEGGDIPPGPTEVPDFTAGPFVVIA